MGKIIYMQDWLDNHSKMKEYAEEIDYCNKMLSKHRLEYSILSHKKSAFFRNIRLKTLQALIKSDRECVEKYTKLYYECTYSSKEAL